MIPYSLQGPWATPPPQKILARSIHNFLRDLVQTQFTPLHANDKEFWKMTMQDPRKNPDPLEKLLNLFL